MTLLQVTPQSLRADQLFAAQRTHVQKEVLPDVGSEGDHLGCGVVTEQAGKGRLRPVDQQVALPLLLVLEAAVTGGAVVEELPEALTSL